MIKHLSRAMVLPFLLVALLPALRAAAQGDVHLVRWTMEADDSTSDAERDLYLEATQALDDRSWDRAIRLFDRVARMNGGRADGALYWKAWAQSRAGRRQDASQTLNQLKSAFPNSRWLGDAKALEIELQNSSGGAPSPDQYEDEELKLIALYGLMENDPARGVAAVEKILKSSSSLTMKERSLYVLAEADSPKAASLLRATAKGGANPDLQLIAIRYLGVSEDKEGMALLEEVFAASRDRNLKYAVIEAWREAEALPQLRRVAESDEDVHLRIAAIHALGDAEDAGTLMKLYSSEKSLDARHAILDALESSDDIQSLEKIVETEKNPELRAEAIRRWADASDGRTAAKLVAMFRQETKEETRFAVLDALSDQDDAGSLIELAKSEKDKQWKLEIVRRLADMDSKEAQAFLESLLN